MLPDKFRFKIDEIGWNRPLEMNMFELESLVLMFSAMFWQMRLVKTKYVTYWKFSTCVIF
jgi:hypothetical protein